MIVSSYTLAKQNDSAEISTSMVVEQYGLPMEVTLRTVRSYEIIIQPPAYFLAKLYQSVIGQNKKTLPD